MDPYVDWMKKRTSWRTYKRERLTEKDRARIEELINDPCDPPFGNFPRFRLIDLESEDGKIGTYGIIRGAQHYIVGAVEKGSMSVEDYGYVLEKIILFATGLELGTCWLGGTFTRSIVSKNLGLEEHEVLPAISPIGYKADRGLVDKAISWGAGSRNRKPWGELFFNQDFGSPLSLDDAGVYSIGFEMVRIAPSASNGQPWRLILDGDRVHFFHDEKEYSTFKQLDMGIALCHFDLTMQEEGVGGIWGRESISDANYVATWTRQ